MGHRRGSDLALLWLWRRLVATAPIRPLAWEPPYAAGSAQEMAKRQKKPNKQKKTKVSGYSSLGYTVNPSCLEFFYIFDLQLVDSVDGEPRV